MWIDRGALEKELTFKTSRSSGAGGQHVNKVESRVSLVWDPSTSKLFTTDQKNRIYTKLASRCHANGMLQLDVSETRSQLENKKRALDKLVHLLIEVLIPEKKRIKTKIPRSIIFKRLEGKRHQSEKKASRRWNSD